MRAVPASMTRPSRRGVAALLVLAVHGLLVLAWVARPPPVEPAAVQPATWLRLLPAEPRPASEAPAPAALPAPRAARPIPAPQSITAPATPPADVAINSSPPAQDIPAAPVPAASATTPAVTPLDLRLPSGAQRGSPPAGPAPQARPRSVESTLSRDLATGPLIEEDLGNGRRRFRQGRRCVEVRDARMAQIDPFNQSVSPVPKQTEDCSR